MARRKECHCKKKKKGRSKAKVRIKEKLEDWKRIIRGMYQKNVGEGFQALSAYL